MPASTLGYQLGCFNWTAATASVSGVLWVPGRRLAVLVGSIDSPCQPWNCNTTLDWITQLLLLPRAPGAGPHAARPGAAALYPIRNIEGATACGVAVSQPPIAAVTAAHGRAGPACGRLECEQHCGQLYGALWTALWMALWVGQHYGRHAMTSSCSETLEHDQMSLRLGLVHRWGWACRQSSYNWRVGHEYSTQGKSRSTFSLTWQKADATICQIIPKSE